MSEDENIINNYFEHFGQDVRPPSELHLAVQTDYNNFERGKRMLQLLRNPPYQEDLEPFLQAYLNEIRSLQDIVRKCVTSIRLALTESEGRNPEHLFDTDMRSVMAEFEKWGLGGIYSQSSFRFCDTGHFYVTIDDARFAQDDLPTMQKVYEQIHSSQDRLVGLYKPIGAFNGFTKLYVSSFYTIIFDLTAFSPNLFGLSKVEFERVKPINQAIDYDSHFVNRGILSLNFVGSLTYRLSKHLDLAENHPGA